MLTQNLPLPARARKSQPVQNLSRLVASLTRDHIRAVRFAGKNGSDRANRLVQALDLAVCAALDCTDDLNSKVDRV